MSDVMQRVEQTLRDDPEANIIAMHVDDVRALLVENERLREVAVDNLATLVAAVALLERGGKKGAPSDTMFDQMLSDYRASISRARAALAEGGGE